MSTLHSIEWWITDNLRLVQDVAFILMLLVAFGLALYVSQVINSKENL
jgi:hypothetical protein